MINEVQMKLKKPDIKIVTLKKLSRWVAEMDRVFILNSLNCFFSPENTKYRESLHLSKEAKHLGVNFESKLSKRRNT